LALCGSAITSGIAFNKRESTQTAARRSDRQREKDRGTPERNAPIYKSGKRSLPDTKISEKKYGAETKNSKLFAPLQLRNKKK
jgi:hypothetical protein